LHVLVECMKVVIVNHQSKFHGRHNFVWWTKVSRGWASAGSYITAHSYSKFTLSSLLYIFCANSCGL